MSQLFLIANFTEEGWGCTGCTFTPSFMGEKIIYVNPLKFSPDMTFTAVHPQIVVPRDLYAGGFQNIVFSGAGPSTSGSKW